METLRSMQMTLLNTASGYIPSYTRTELTDMVIYDAKLNTCECYEIKHSSKIVPMQARFLVDEEKLNQTSHRFGQITKRCVLYRGEDSVMENGVEYQNVENYLKHL